jgi:tetratricopeptide (TPR) repeat protein
MSSTQALQTAIQAARTGKKEEARNLLMQVVEADPQNEMAWMWLVGLVDSFEDRIIACENVLTINPGNENARAYLTKLLRQQRAVLADERIDDAFRLLVRAKEHAERNQTDAALHLARQAVQKQESYEEAWLFIGRLSPDVDEQIQALRKASRLNPSSAETGRALKQVQYLKANPLSAARRLEQAGKFDQALKLYQELAGKAKDSREFDHIYRQIIRIEELQQENIRYIAPAISIARLAISWPLLYLSLALVQVGLNPFAHPALYLWLGLPLVIIGSFLLSLAEIRSQHIFWQELFDEHGDGSTFARLVTASAGWFLVILPHVLLVLDSLNRLRTFQIPAMPF